MEHLLRNVEEVVTKEEFLNLRGGVAYLGFEPLWPIHVGWLVWAHKLAELREAGFDVVVLVATWHAWINDKGSLEELRSHGEKVKAVLDKIGKFKYVYGDEIAKDPRYWELVVKTAKETSLARVRRATPVMGRRTEEVELDFSKLLYPIMQVADIFYLGVDVAVGGMDQRRAHMLARDVAERLGFKKPVAIHTPIITSLSGTGRMEGTHRELDEVYAMYKMSKSKPQSAILVTDAEEEVRRKIWAAYCPPRETKFNPVFEIAAYLLIPYGGPLEVGGRRYEDAEALGKDYREGAVSPQALKEAVAAALAAMLTRLGAPRS
ncbi:tyrosine--tRNA ligase [Pyrobaculum neutrophilum]|uniref:Tyrosine--tRNA ligase n=1 Tax=Pyrobaculum neutrophilum (strain DSM 2338 / JCM 9278 / NBRC 100436 / V24Sta) TaxID=444157 RepID=B1YD67_PYRNV|nr:tyrosine--tRNA ligase [Pyrobaculum neutrophilum]ACB39730.1 tyrosyl-tRNA synthetase [Pyrobaculum neutrophilum V24Sta]